MPNHCNNYIRISGEGLSKIYALFPKESKEDIDILDVCLPMPPELEVAAGGSWEIEKAKVWLRLGKPEEFQFKIDKQDLSINTKGTYFSSDITIAEGFQRILDNMENHGFADWYGWKIATWGSKWGHYDVNVSEKGDTAFAFGAQSAWGPNLTGLEAISKKFDVRVEITYSEPGMDFAGHAVFDKGNVVKEIESSVMVTKGVPLSAEDFAIMEDDMEICIVDDTLTPQSKVGDADVDDWITASEVTYEEYVRLCKGECIPCSDNP